MIAITNAAEMARALASFLPSEIKALLDMRRKQLLQDTAGAYELGDLANWIVVTPGDTISEIEAMTGFAIAPDPPWEWVQDHSGIFEAPTIVDDGGFGIVLIVPDHDGIDPTLLVLLRNQARPATPPEK